MYFDDFRWIWMIIVNMVYHRRGLLLGIRKDSMSTIESRHREPPSRTALAAVESLGWNKKNKKFTEEDSKGLAHEASEWGDKPGGETFVRSLARYSHTHGM